MGPDELMMGSFGGRFVCCIALVYELRGLDAAMQLSHS